jgi:hypothetical protein
VERPRGRSAYVGLMRLRIGLAELAAALRLRCGLPPGEPRLAEPALRFLRLPEG